MIMVDDSSEYMN